MNISFTDQQQKYIAKQVKSGDYQNASEVVRDAMRLHKFYRHHIIEELRNAVDLGWQGEESSRSVSDILDAKQRQTKIGKARISKTAK